MKFIWIKNTKKPEKVYRNSLFTIKWDVYYLKFSFKKLFLMNSLTDLDTGEILDTYDEYTSWWIFGKKSYSCDVDGYDTLGEHHLLIKSVY